jgi:MarR family transcriptional regulator, lower aerobic nicotinate degradation pathway regulator
VQAIDRRLAEHAPELLRPLLGTGRDDDVGTCGEVAADDALARGARAARHEKTTVGLSNGYDGGVAETDDAVRAPARLRGLASWQASKAATLGARLFARRMPLGARAEFAVLAALEEYGALSQADIGRRLGLDRNDVNGVLGRLESHQRVDRQADPANRRRNIVTLTAAGRRHLAELQRHADAVQDELLAGLDPVERQQLQALLAKLLDSHRPQPA